MVDCLRRRQSDFSASSSSSTKIPAPNVRDRSSKCRGPNRNRLLANGHKSVRPRIVETTTSTITRVEFGLRMASANEALNDRLTIIKPTIVMTSEKKASARTSFSGIPRYVADRKIAATKTNDTVP